jgi:hypothetical protein
VGAAVRGREAVVVLDIGATDRGSSHANERAQRWAMVLWHATAA